MSSCMYSRTRFHTTKCGPSCTTACTLRFEANAPSGRHLMLRNMRNQPSNLTPNPPSSRKTWSHYHQTQQPSSRRTWSQCHQTRFLAEDSHQPEVHLDDAGNDPDMPADTNDLPDVSMDRPLRVSFGKELRYALTLAELIRCRCHRDGTLQSVPLRKVGPNTPYPSSLKGTHRRVHRHYQCKDLTSTAVWAAAYQEDPRTRHILKVAVRSPAAEDI